MDSIYSALRSGADFSLLARRYSDDADSRQVGGLLPWMPVNKNMQEWVNKLTVLEKNKISVPFYSPLGLHIVKWVERKPLPHITTKGGNTSIYGAWRSLLFFGQKRCFSPLPVRGFGREISRLGVTFARGT